ncbi:MAG TPA: hypothetical protein VG123_08740, partial [Streptosporangiaceae bacterium]|nr:hypothetical protein [Streptosporangiaceae bacterium]
GSDASACPPGPAQPSLVTGTHVVMLRQPFGPAAARDVSPGVPGPPASAPVPSWLSILMRQVRFMAADCTGQPSRP